jgi:hypothetical protein
MADAIAEKIGDPQHLQQENAHRRHRQKQWRFEPNANERKEEGHVTEVKKIGWPVVMPIDGDEYCHERGVEKLNQEWNAAFMHVIFPNPRRPGTRL